MSKRAGATFCFARAFAYALRIARFSALMLGVGAVLLLVDQGQDVLVGLAEDISAGEAAVWRFTKFCLSVFFWAFSIWLWARTLLDVDFGDAPNCPRWLPFWRAHLPRALGVTAFAAVAWALWRTRDIVPTDLQVTLRWLTIATLVLGLVFYALVYFRRRWSRRLAAKLGSPTLARRLHVEDIKPGDDFPLGSFWQVFRGLRGIFVGLFVLSNAAKSRIRAYLEHGTTKCSSDNGRALEDVLGVLAD